MCHVLSSLQISHILGVSEFYWLCWHCAPWCSLCEQCMGSKRRCYRHRSQYPNRSDEQNCSCPRKCYHYFECNIACYHYFGSERYWMCFVFGQCSADDRSIGSARWIIYSTDQFKLYDYRAKHLSTNDHISERTCIL